MTSERRRSTRLAHDQNETPLSARTGLRSNTTLDRGHLMHTALLRRSMLRTTKVHYPTTTLLLT